jgi:hypothetical protein
MAKEGTYKTQERKKEQQLNLISKEHFQKI